MPEILEKSEQPWASKGSPASVGEHHGPQLQRQYVRVGHQCPAEMAHSGEEEASHREGVRAQQRQQDPEDPRDHCLGLFMNTTQKSQGRPALITRGREKDFAGDSSPGRADWHKRHTAQAVPVTSPRGEMREAQLGNANYRDVKAGFQDPPQSSGDS